MSPQEVKLKILTRQFLSLQEQFEDTKNVVETANTHLTNQFKSMTCPENKAPHDDTNSQIEVNIESKNISKESKSVFKKIAKKIHPDKMFGKTQKEKSHASDIYQRADKALQDDNYILLTAMAAELGIDIEIDITFRIKETEKTIQFLKKEINVLESTYVWKWFFADEKEKLKIEEELFKLMKNENNRP